MCEEHKSVESGAWGAVGIVPYAAARAAPAQGTGVIHFSEAGESLVKSACSAVHSAQQ